MEWSTREADILQLLLDSEEPLQTQEIADKMGISARTVQRSLPYISDAVNRYGMMMVRSRSKGNRLTGTNPFPGLRKLTRRTGLRGRDICCFLF